MTATADPWPKLYDVRNVAPDDVLNIRNEPTVDSEVIGQLPHDGSNIEVVEADVSGKWGLVNKGETSGWVSLRFLAAPLMTGDLNFPAISMCYGTEPFWDLAVEDDTVTFNQAFDDASHVAAEMSWRGRAFGHVGHYAFVAEGLTGIVTRGACNDGMSDRAFGLTINLLLKRHGEGTHSHQLFHGCCSIQPHAE